MAALVGRPVSLRGVVTYTNPAPTTNLWTLYSGPGHVTFGNAAQTNSTALFDAAGAYTLMLKSDDGIHTPAYDAVNISVSRV